jgi:hypothetical protein
MSFQPNPQQAQLLLSMLLSEKTEKREPTLKASGLNPELRGSLIKAGLIAEFKRPKSRSTNLKLLAKGQAWASENLTYPFPALPRRPALATLMQIAVRKLQPFLLRHRAEISHILNPTTRPMTVESIEDQIREAYFAATNGVTKQRVLLKDLRPKVGVQRQDFDQALLSLQKENKVVLAGLDDANERTEEVEAAALSIAGNARHLVYFQG